MQTGSVPNRHLFASQVKNLSSSKHQLTIYRPRQQARPASTQHRVKTYENQVGSNPNRHLIPSIAKKNHPAFSCKSASKGLQATLASPRQQGQTGLDSTPGKNSSLVFRHLHQKNPEYPQTS
ncbi:hypothetical protein Nepgr_021015 [Nepenthes gracilis]|uniref:Uncharacterized protein n=1 Tax=Nepenthes gracilis TaxID=150966 RepID=A0AAD3SYT0_NEPGR|nr:hypothetical protein Nepgr_021015 [Nepenthes gracilis]